MKTFIEKFGFWVLTALLGGNLFFARSAWDDVKGSIIELRAQLTSQGASMLDIRIEQAVLKTTVNDMREKLNKRGG